jgi:hypothetical protein
VWPATLGDAGPASLGESGPAVLGEAGGGSPKQERERQGRRMR